MEKLFYAIGGKGLIILIGLVTFIWTYKYSQVFFSWVEEQTYGTRDYLMKKFEFLHITIQEQHLTYLLLSVSFGLSIFVFCLFALFAKFILGAILALIVLIIGWKSPRMIVDMLAENRIKAYSNQMVDGLNLLSNGIRAGLSVPQALAMVVNEMPSPISQEFAIVLQQNKIGSPLEECFEELAKRVPLEDNDMFVSSINILRETGGNLAETFDTIIDVIRERVRLKQKVDTFVAQGMMQGVTIFCMPFAMMLIFFISDPNSMIPLFTKPMGIALLMLALLFDLAGGFVIMKIVKIKI
jgi:tight adherence protein B